MASLKHDMEFEDILTVVGDNGKYQKRLLLFFLFPSVALLPWFSMNNLLFVFVPDHTCYVPEVANSNLSIEVQHSLVSPNDSSCMRYDLNYTEVINSGDFSIKNDTPLVPCDQFLYDTTFFEETSASKVGVRISIIEWDDQLIFLQGHNVLKLVARKYLVAEKSKFVDMNSHACICESTCGWY